MPYDAVATDGYSNGYSGRMMTETLTLTEFLLARIAEDEAIARDVAAERVRVGEVIGYPTEGEDFSFWADYDGAGPSVSVGAHRVLRRCEADRRIVEECARWAGGNWGDMEVGELYELADTTLAALALSYADHPDYREEWKP